MKDKFTILYESIIDDLNSLEDLENEPKKEYKSYEEFRHFCKNNDLITKLDEEADDSDKVIECSLYFMNEKDTDNKPVRFDYYNQNVPEYYKQYHQLFDLMKDYKKHYIVTLDGKAGSKKIIWG